jgi:hypothetical protein
MNIKHIKKAVGVAVIVVVGVLQWSGVIESNGSSNGQTATSNKSTKHTGGKPSSLTNAIKNQQSDVIVEGVGKVVKVLPDDTKGSQHQKFILKINTGETILVAHNIDLAPRVAGIAKYDEVGFKGEFEWNNRGGVVHWTHHDPRGKHVGGWLKHNGKTYE